MGILTDVGGEVGIRWAFPPQATVAATITGDAIDRKDFGSAVVTHRVGAITGAPDSFTVTSTLQDADTATGDYLDVATITTLSAINTSALTNVNATSLRRWVRLVDTVAFVGGTLPTVTVAAIVVLGGHS